MRVASLALPSLLALTLVACSGDEDLSGAGSSGDDTTSEGAGETEPGTATTTGDSSSGASSSSATGTSDATATSDATDATTTSTTTTTTTDATTTDTTTDEGPRCPGGGLMPGDHTIMLEHDGVMRSSLVHVPPGYDPLTPTPLVLNFHGLTSNAGQQVFFSGMNPTSDKEGFVVAYPEGLNSSWNAGVCCGTSMEQGVDDVGFVRELVAELGTLLCVDDRRVYATGMSNGGFMSNRLACEAADLFAAVAPVSSVNGMLACAPSRPIPVMLFNGTLDPLVSYDGGLFIGAPETFADWGDRDLCVGAPVVTKTVGAASCETYEACGDGVEVTFCTLTGMGHCWPGNAFCPLGAANTDIDANAEMWAFFSAFTLP